MDEYFKMTTGSKLICYYDEMHTLILFDIVVYTISEPKMFRIDMYDEEGHCLDTFYYYKKETKTLLDNWCLSQPLYYDIFEAKNIELNIDGTLREINLSLYEKLKNLTKSPSSSVTSSPRGGSMSPKHSATPSPRSGTISPREVKPLTPRNVLLPSLSRNITPRSSTSSSSSTPRSNSSTPRSATPISDSK